MKEGKERNFISAVVYMHNSEGEVAGFFSELLNQLEQHFSQYEIIAVDDCSQDDSVSLAKSYATTTAKPFTLLHMSRRQGIEQCMNAGLDASIGDYVLEFDSMEMNYPAPLIWRAYTMAQEGNDIVSVCPDQQTGLSRAFYKVFNRYSSSGYPLRTDAFRLVSRRAINRVHAVSENLPYRKAAYAASGLKMGTLSFSGYNRSKERDRMDLAVESLLLYTNAGYKISLNVTFFMLAMATVELLYTLAVFLGGGRPVEGWTTTMLVLTVGFTGLFAILAVVIKYLSLILDVVFRQEKYFVESVEKIQQ